MKLNLVDFLGKSTVPHTNVMSSPSHAVDTVNAMNLASRMDVGIDVLSQAIGVNPSELQNNPRDPNLQEKLRAIAALWEDVLILAGDQAHGRLFLNQQRPELRGNTPMYYLQHGRPNVVRRFVVSMLEMLP